MPFSPTTHFPRHHLAQSLGAACIARLWLGFAWLMLLSLCCSASLGFAWLGSLGFTQLSFARLSRRSARSARSARIASLSLASWLAAHITGSHHSACVGSRQLWLALLGSRHEPSVTRLRLTCVAGWLTSSLACFAGVAGSLTGARAQLSSLGTLLGLTSFRSASHRWLALLACCSHRWLPLLGLCQHQLTSHRLARDALLAFFQ
jgi:hypothetical protein